MKEDYQKALKKLTLFFLSNPVPFIGQEYEKQKGPGSSDQLLFMVTKLLTFTFYFVIFRDIDKTYIVFC